MRSERKKNKTRETFFLKKYLLHPLSWLVPYLTPSHSNKQQKYYGWLHAGEQYQKAEWATT
jgi:hypothetical protein